MKNPLHGCQFYERDSYGRFKELRWDEYLMSVDAMEKRPEIPFHQGRLLIKLDPGVTLTSAGLFQIHKP